MTQIAFTLEYLWVHFAVYARAFTASVRRVHDEIGEVNLDGAYAKPF